MTMTIAPGDHPVVPVVTADQLALIKTTIAKDATDTELQLFFYDCQRQGVHPLDKLIHFTKRGGKYTPIASIDFMRQRAAQTGECAGIDDAIFAGPPKSPFFMATVTVYRIVHGHRGAFTATARWTEYKPEQNDFMWQKMPFVMLGKCAEALALRKGFPQQLAGLYAKEELDQAEAAPSSAPEDTRPITDTQRRALFAAARGGGWSEVDFKAWLVAQGVGSTAKIRRGEYAAVMAALQRAVNPLPAPLAAAAHKTSTGGEP
jgi:phage recombination protein Bet